jgi:hypothetical protein
MHAKRQPAATIAVLSCVGVLAAILSILLPSLLMGRTSPIFVGSALGIFPGDVFGAVLAMYFAVFAGIRSITKAIGLIIASTFAYGVAYFGGTFLGMFVAGTLHFSIDPGNSGDLTAGMVAPIGIAGVIGAFVLVTAVLRIYAGELSWQRVLKASFACSAAGGFLALRGWALGSPLGSLLYRMQPSISGQDMNFAARGGALSLLSAHLVWQAGMGVVLGVLLSDIPLTAAQPQPRGRAGLKLNLGNILLFGCMGLALVWYVRRWLPDEFRDSRWQRAYAKHVADTPSAENLPQIELQSADAMLILAPFGEYLPRRPGAGMGHNVAVSGPQFQGYNVRYSPAGAPDGGPKIGPHVDVHIEEWPNAAWAKWELSNGNLAPELNMGIEQPVKFGNRVIYQHAPSDRWGPNQTYAWVSQNKIVTIELSSVPADEFLEKYLQRYPSSL